MAELSAYEISMARRLKAVVGGEHRLHRYIDDNKQSQTFIFSVAGKPWEGLCTFGTAGLSQHPLLDREGKEYETRVEFIGCCHAEQRHFDNIVATAAFCVINSKWFCYPGAVFPDIVRMYARRTPMKHITFVSPGYWGGKLRTKKIAGRNVSWLLLVPISDGERKFLEIEGIDAFEDQLEQCEIDIFDLKRRSLF